MQFVPWWTLFILFMFFLVETSIISLLNDWQYLKFAKNTSERNLALKFHVEREKQFFKETKSLNCFSRIFYIKIGSLLI